MDKVLAQKLHPLINSQAFEYAIKEYVAYRKGERQRIATMGRDVYALGEHNGACQELELLSGLIERVKGVLKNA